MGCMGGGEALQRWGWGWVRGTAKVGPTPVHEGGQRHCNGGVHGAGGGGTAKVGPASTHGVGVVKGKYALLHNGAQPTCSNWICFPQ